MRSQNPSISIAGSNIAAWTLAYLLGKEGKSVHLLCSTDYPGGIFRGVECDGIRFDAGLVVIEKFSSNRDDFAKLSGYQPGLRNDYGRFFRYVEELLDALEISTIEKKKAELVFQKKLIPDFLSGDRLSGLKALPNNVQAAMTAELGEILKNPESPFHARGKATKASFLKADLDTVSLANHGSTFHSLFIEPFLKKAFLTSGTALIGLYHRVLWLPLFYPETLFATLSKDEFHIPDSVFYGVRGGLVSDLVRNLEVAVRALPQVVIEKVTVTQITPSDGRQTKLRFSENRELLCDRLVWTGEPEELRRLVTNEPSARAERTSLSVFFALLPLERLRREFSSLLLPESDEFFYRISLQTDLSNESKSDTIQLSFEFNPGLDPQPCTLESVKQSALHILETLGLITEGSEFSGCWLKTFPNSITLPSPENLHCSAEVLKWADEHIPGIHRMGNSLGFACNALNEQIIQAYHLCEALR